MPSQTGSMPGMKQLAVLGVFILLLAAPPAFGRDAQRDSAVRTRVDRVDISEWGIYKTEVVRTVDAPESLSGKASTVSRRKTELLTETDRIPAVLGTLFGFRYTLVGEPRHRKVPLTLKILLPPPQGQMASDQVRPTITHTLTPPISKKDFVGFGFQTKEEQIPGTWTFQISYGDRLMAEKSFTVFLPNPTQPDTH